PLPCFAAHSARLGRGRPVRGNAADAVLLGTVSSFRRRRRANGLGPGRPLAPGDAADAGGTAGRIYALHASHGRRSRCAGGPAATDAGGHARLVLPRSRAGDASRTGWNNPGDVRGDGQVMNRLLRIDWDLIAGITAAVVAIILHLLHI